MRRRRPPNEPLGRWLLLAIGLHAAAVIALLIEPRLFPALPAPPPEVLAQVEMVQVDPRHIGEADPQRGGAGPASPPPSTAAPDTQPSAQRVKPRAADAAKLQPTQSQEEPSEPVPPPKQPAPAPSPTTPAQPKQVTMAAQNSATEVRLGDDAPLEESTAGAYAFGAGVVPASPDAAAHNTPPAYPKEAARRGEHGTVILVIHVTPDGSVGSVDVARSSGSATLDEAARSAAARWHFRPALQAGAAVASDFTMRVTFEL